MSTPDAIIAALRADTLLLQSAVADAEQVAHDLRHERDEALAKLSVLEARIEQMRKRIYGASSERHHPGQQSLPFGVPAELPALPVAAASSTETSPISPASVSASDAPAVTATRSIGKRPQAGRHPGRRALPADAEVVISDVTVPEQERLDANGQPLPMLGYRTTDKWDYRVGTYLIRRFRRAIYGRPFSEASERIVAPAPASLIPHGTMTDAALIHTVIEKFADHLPLYRQQQRAARTGIHLSRATLVGHVAAVAAAVQPIVAAIAAQVCAARYVHLDDTPVKLLSPGQGKTITGRIWVYRSAHDTVFQFTASREGRHPAEFLGDYRGFIVADAYAGHNRLYGAERATFVCCWAHTRRNFHKIRDRYPFAMRMVEDAQRLYHIEDELRFVSEDERQRARQLCAVPLLADIHRRLTSARSVALPSSDLGIAIDYALSRWPTLTCYTEHGFLPIDNNPAENALRPWAIGRKNWLFVGSVTGGERAAILATLIENCRMQGLDPYAYLCATVAALHQGRTDYHALTPRAVAHADDRAIA